LLISRQKAGPGIADNTQIESFDKAVELIGAIRNVRNEKGLSPKESLRLFVKSDNGSLQLFTALVEKLANLNSITKAEETPLHSVRLSTKSGEYFVELSDKFDRAAETEKLQKELDYTKGFLDSVRKKLSNEKFMANAKLEVVESERKKEQDALQKISMIEIQLSEIQLS
jgi:valyl-tRNA synthetase